jgi:putative restriction endonuclease
MKLRKPQDLFSLSSGDTITKRNLFDLIQFSKVYSSSFWAGPDFKIGNTPQQGINWIGNLPVVKAVIIKTSQGSYKEDGWKNEQKTIYHYSFKARDGKVSLKEKANEVLIKQPQHLYPVLLFTSTKKGWNFEGEFSVTEIEETYVVLQLSALSISEVDSSQDEAMYSEGERRYVTHLMVERNKAVVTAIKNSTTWLCEICNIDFKEKYGVPYIEAHHKIPVSKYTSKQKINCKDLALLCPNCHKAVHIFMKIKNQDYDQIKSILKIKYQ